MVDELELLKKDWKKQEASLPKVTAKEIYPMLLKKSSSIVKWIFIISIFEFSFWLFITIFLRDIYTSDLQTESAGINRFEIVFLVVHASILLFFMFKFYTSFKRIESTDSAASLMKNILKTRKTVKHYILASIGLFIIGATVTTKLILDLNAEAFEGVNHLVLFGALVLILLVGVGILWFIYNKVYGILLKRLHVNYEELQKIQV